MFRAFSYAQREALADVLGNVCVFNAADKIRYAQEISLYGMELTQALPGFSDAQAKQTWLTDPACGALPMSLFPSTPPDCQVCLFPCIFPRPAIAEVRIREKNGRRVAFCSEACEWIYDLEPQRYQGYVHFYEKFEGWSLADVIRHFGYIRPDGKTLMAQPSLDQKRMWTIADIERLGSEIKNPLRQS